MKKLLLLLILLVSLSGCQKEETLNPPTNVRYQEETILWNSVEGATSYTVVLNDVTYSVTEPLFDMHDSSNGDYTARVCAHKGDVQSIYSSTLSFTIDRMFDHPTSISIDDGVMTWQGVDNAESYVVSVNDVEYPVTIAMIDLSFLDENETYDLRVKAVFELGESDYSSPIEHLTYEDVISTYNGLYNINISHNPLIYLDVMYHIDHVYYNNNFLENDDFVIQEDGLSINYELLEDFALGYHTIQLYTSDGIVELSLEITQNTDPVMVSSNSANYVVGEDIEFVFELFGSTFVGLSGHDITETDYVFNENTLTIFSEYLDPKIATFESDTIIFTYQIKIGDSITLGYIFIRIP